MRGWKKKALLALLLWLVLGLAEVPGAKELEEALRSLAGVEKVETLEEQGDWYERKFLLTFSQPLDWKDPEKGSFPQRVELGIRKGARANVLETNGYLLMEDLLRSEDEHELCVFLNANYIHIEHRFFGESVPEGLSNDGTRYWEYLTDENAAADFHAIYEALSQVLSGPWVGTGSSRGGLVCESYALAYPQDMKGIVSYVAPCSQGLEDERMFPFIYESIGEEAFGKKEARRRRRLVTRLQVTFMRHKEELAPLLWEKAKEMGYRYREAMDQDTLFDLTVMESAVTFWQYCQDFDYLRSLLNLPEEETETTSALLGALFTLGRPGDWSTEQELFRYYINMFTEYGLYHYDFSWLRKALEKEGLEDRLSITEEEEKGLLWRILLTSAQQNLLSYRGTFYKRIVSWIDTTDTPLILLYGGSDPWYSMRIKDTDNEKVHVFVLPEGNHCVQLSDFGQEEREEIGSLVKSWLVEKHRPRQEGRFQ